MTRRTSTRVGVVVAVGALALAACGSDDDAAEPADAPDGASEAPDDADETDAMDEMDEMDGMDHSTMDMNMGDPDATPADEVTGAALARGEYELLDTRPAGYDDLAGTAVIARHPGGTTVTTELTGLLPNVDYISHLHAQPCDDDNGGPHYQFEVGGSEFPPNEIHLAFTSDDDGNGFMTAENARIAGLDAVAFVIHPAEFIDNKVACVDFVEDESGAAAAALEAGLDPDAMATMDESMDDTDHSMDDMDDMESMDDEG